ncbi:MAG: VIT1/CCC1 transporter family protein [Candidatus Marsarchaeota archaeon]|nr:VIT1/CCC1 transporter family protein [Candidatus Marsarchaeota archaeon]
MKNAKNLKKFLERESKKNKKYIQKLCEVELLHKKVYKKLSEKEKNPEIKTLLINFSKEEKNHADRYRQILNKNIKISQIKMRIYLFFLRFLRYATGLSIFIKILEYDENNLHIKLNKTIGLLKKHGIKNLKEIGLLKKIEDDEKKNEIPLSNKIISYNKTLNNIKDIGLSLNDGLVEILATCVGIAAALQQPLLVAIAGFIVAVSGALSMSGGTYISTDYERTLNINIFKKNKELKSPLISGIYSAIFYIVGAFFPLIPFIIGFNIVFAIILSIILSIIILIITSVLISIISTTSILNRVIKTLIISLSAVIISIILGYYARKLFHITL